MYHAGQVTVMEGRSFEHGRLEGNLIGKLFAALAGRGCGVVGSDALFQTGRQPRFTDPDVMVICGLVTKLPGRPSVGTNPVFVACEFSSLECRIPMAALYEGVLEV
jgi:hypothetical protein